VFKTRFKQFFAQIFIRHFRDSPANVAAMAKSVLHTYGVREAQKAQRPA
jgi:hypothetical protein